MNTRLQQHKEDFIRDIIEEFDGGWVEGPDDERILFDDDQDREIEVIPQCHDGSADEMVDFVYIRGDSAHPSGLRCLDYPGEFEEWLRELSITELQILYASIPC